MTYKICKIVIENKTYYSKSDMQDKLDIFLLNNRITDEQYNDLVKLLNETADEKTQNNN